MLPLPAGREASSGVGAPVYTRHRPERTLLYQLVQEYYPAFRAPLAAQGTVLPGYAEQEFEDYLKCGRLEHGFLWVCGVACYAEHLVAFSCKNAAYVRAVGRGAWLTSAGMQPYFHCPAQTRSIAPGEFSLRIVTALLHAYVPNTYFPQYPSLCMRVKFDTLAEIINNLTTIILWSTMRMSVGTA